MKENKLDKYIKEKKEKYFGASKEIQEFITGVLESEEILRLAPINECGTCSPGALFYLGEEKLLKKIIRAKGGISSYADSNNYEETVDEVHITAIPKTHNSYRLTFESGGNNRIPVKEKGALSKFAIKLSSKYMVDAGFRYNPTLKTLEQRTGKEVKKITKSSLENCVENYFIKPLLEKEING